MVAALTLNLYIPQKDWAALSLVLRSVSSALLGWGFSEIWLGLEMEPKAKGCLQTLHQVASKHAEAGCCVRLNC